MGGGWGGGVLILGSWDFNGLYGGRGGEEGCIMCI